MRFSYFLIALCLGSCQAAAQQSLELRGANTKYRFADWSYTTRKSVIVDLFYVGVPGSNEFNLGGGYGIKVVPSLTIAPVAYAVIGKEDGQRGVKVGALVFFESDQWKGSAFIAHYARIAGSVGHYQVLDTADLTHTLYGRWDAGVSAGFFHSGGAWGPQVGPLVKHSDRLGAWGVSYRFGPDPEFRVTRVLTITK